MEIEEKNVDNVGVLSLKGRLDAYSSNQVEQSLNELIDKGEKKSL